MGEPLGSTEGALGGPKDVLARLGTQGMAERFIACAPRNVTPIDCHTGLDPGRVKDIHAPWPPLAVGGPGKLSVLWRDPGRP